MMNMVTRFPPLGTGIWISARDTCKLKPWRSRNHWISRGIEMVERSKWKERSRNRWGRYCMSIKERNRMQPVLLPPWILASSILSSWYLSNDPRFHKGVGGGTLTFVPTTTTKATSCQVTQSTPFQLGVWQVESRKKFPISFLENF